MISAGLSQALAPAARAAAARLDAAAPRAWSQPGWIKVAMEFRLEPSPVGTVRTVRAPSWSQVRKMPMKITRILPM